MNTGDRAGGNAEVLLEGSLICPGIAIGTAHWIDIDLEFKPLDIAPSLIEAEQQRYTAAVSETMHRLHDHVATTHGVSHTEIRAIFDIHQAILADDSFHDKVRDRIAGEKKSAEWCLQEEGSSLISKFAAMRDPYLKDRSEDIRDMTQNLADVLFGGKGKSGLGDKKQGVMLSRHLNSSDVILAQRSHQCGFVSESRALVSHAAILLKGFGIPSLGGVAGLCDAAHEEDPIIVDGYKGVVIVRPSSPTLEAYRKRMKSAEVFTPVPDLAGCVTAEGIRISLKANIENPEQIKLMRDRGLDGVGLLRTEYLISAEGRMPTEDEQYTAYRHIIENAAGKLVTIRTFDIGGDKPMGLADRCTGRNPSLGLRGIRRHLMMHPEELRMQLKAVLRAAAGYKVGILIPMVTTVNDIMEVKHHMASVYNDLGEEDAAFSNNALLGAMIETPAAAAIIRDILSEVDFISIGTNDLLQYFMAADRDNERVLHYNDAASPAFLWLLEQILMQARRSGRECDVTMCGEVAADIRVLPHLLRMGYRSFSISPMLSAVFRDACMKYGLKD
ncbi:MAG: phosphoenolpyruvate--protein phosphotransferase [Acidobacteria bacterium]|nr:phosphoenolpyruvate--protein phosphotransferase [Acidobacteriota bacterium]